MKYCLKFGISLLLYSSQVAAWSGLYHEAIVHDALTQVSDKTRTNIDKIIGPLPLSVWASWADDIRAHDRSYHRWHHIHVDDIEKPCVGQENLKCGIFKLQNVLKGQDQSLSKETALKLLVHMVADMHQPLHVNMPGFYNGKCFFKIDSPARKSKAYQFHSFMDGLVVNKPYRGVIDVATIIATHRYTLPLDQKIDITSWLKDSANLQYQIMPELIYGQVPRYCKVSKKPVQAIMINKDKTDRMAEIAWGQLAHSSRRLAMILDESLGR